MSNTRDYNFKNKQRYVDILMERNANNPNITAGQAQFLQRLCEYRHLLHSNPHQYFFYTKKSAEIDRFFALVQSQSFFQTIDLPYPKDMFDILFTVKANRDMQFTDFDKAVEQFANNNEAANKVIERYLRQIDEEKNTMYCPSGDRRDPSVDPVQQTIDKLNNAQERISPHRQRIQQELDNLNRSKENTHPISDEPEL